MTKLCKDCKWHKRTNWLWGFGKFARCMHAQAARFSSFGSPYHLVDGSAPVSEQSYCVTMRQFDCGTEAKFFEAKE